MPLNPDHRKSAIDAALDARNIITYAANKVDVGAMAVESFAEELKRAQATVGISLRHLATLQSNANQMTLDI